MPIVTVQTGAITAVAALADLILFLAFPVSLSIYLLHACVFTLAQGTTL